MPIFFRTSTPLLAALVLLASARAEAAVTLVDNGQPRVVIVVDPQVYGEGAWPEKSSHWNDVTPEGLQLRLRESVFDLAHYLEQMSGAKVPIVTKLADVPAGKVPILIGAAAQGKHAPPDATPTRQAYRVVIDKQGVALVGESDLATSYAIYTLLHELGCRWFIPSDMGEVVPAKKTIVLEERNVTERPHTEYRGIWYADTHYCRRNRMGGRLLNAGHALENYITKEQREKHPEWVGTVGGKPQPVRLRWSAPGLPEAIADYLLAQQEKNPQTVSWSLSPDDGLGYDDSEQDKALDAGDFDPSIQAISITDRQVWLCNRIVDRVSQKHPDLIFGMLAYAVSTRPPVREKLHPKLIPQIAPITFSRVHPMTDDGEPNNKAFRALVEGWGKAVPAVSYYYYCYYLAEPAAPNPFIAKWRVDVPMAFRHNCRYWQPETLSNFETAMHASYLGTRLAWDPKQKPEEVFDELHRLFYGSAAKEMAEYWNYIDGVWVGTPEYSGCGFGHLRRFRGEKIAKARALLNAALAKAATPQEKFRVGMADDSLKLFELFLKLRADLNDGRFATLAEDAKRYQALCTELGGKYQKQFAFGRMGWTGDEGIYGVYFRSFYKATYDDAARVAKDFTILTSPPLQQWRWQADAKNVGESAGWQQPAFDDSKWKSTNPGLDTWSALGLHNYMGSLWYRHQVQVPAVPAGKKVSLWLGATDGSAKVFVNGQHVPYINDKGEKSAEFTGYCQPASFDITAAIKPGAENTIAILATRTFLNELGTGGLIAPAVLYREP